MSEKSESNSKFYQKIDLDNDIREGELWDNVGKISNEIVRSNPQKKMLVEGDGKVVKELSVHAVRVYFLLWALVEENKINMVFKKEQLILFGIPRSRYKVTLESALESLRLHRFEIKEKDGSVTVVGLVSSYNVGKNEVTISYHPTLYPYLKDVKDQFTIFSFKCFLNLTQSKYSLYLYVLFESYLHDKENIGASWDLSIGLDDLKAHLSVSGKYNQIGGFVKKVLTPAVTELATTSNINVEMTYKKIKKEYVFNFKITRQLYQADFFNENTKEELIKGIELMIPQDITDKLSEIGYKLKNKAKDYITDHIKEFGDDIVYKAIVKVSEWSDVSYRAKMVKSLLPLYCEELRKDQQLVESLSERKIEEDDQQTIIDIQKAREKENWEEFKILNKSEYDQIVQQLKNDPDFTYLDSDNIIDICAKKKWMDKQNG